MFTHRTWSRIPPPNPIRIPLILMGNLCVSADDAEFPNADLKSAMRKKESGMSLHWKGANPYQRYAAFLRRHVKIPAESPWISVLKNPGWEQGLWAHSHIAATACSGQWLNCAAIGNRMWAWFYGQNMRTHPKNVCFRVCSHGWFSMLKFSAQKKPCGLAPFCLGCLTRNPHQKRDMSLPLFRGTDFK